MFDDSLIQACKSDSDKFVLIELEWISNVVQMNFLLSAEVE